MMMNLIANITLLVAALLDMIGLLGGDITAHCHNGHSNSRYYGWLSKSGELMSPKRLLSLAVFLGTFTTMAQQSWIVVLILAATLLTQAIVLLSRRHWQLMEPGKNHGRMLATALIIVLIAIGLVGYFGSKTSMVFASRITSMLAVMIPPITWLLTMLTAWLIHPHNSVIDRGPQEPQD